MQELLCYTAKKSLLPDFLATTRLKIMFDYKTLPHSFYEIQHPKAMFALQYVTNFVNSAKEIFCHL